MSEQDRGHFEQEWADAFNGKEMMPNEAVWSKIELGVARQEGNSFKRRLMMFKLLAAASISFAMVVSGLQVYKTYFKTEQNSAVALEENGNQIAVPLAEANGNTSINKVNSEQEKIAKSPDGSLVDSESNLKNNLSSKENKQQEAIQLFLKVESEQLPENHNHLTQITEGAGDLPAENMTFLLDFLERLNAQLEEYEPKTAELKMVPWLAYANGKKEKKDLDGTRTFAGVGMSAGSYNPNALDGGGSRLEAATINDFSSSGAEAINTPESTGTALSFGLNAGTKIAHRWLLMGGVNYLEQTSTSVSNLVQLNEAGRASVGSASTFDEGSTIALTDAYKITNTYQFISVPIQVGYVVLDKRFGIAILTGAANDFFIQQKIEDNSESVSGATISNNQQGYSVYSISGILGSEFSYKIGEHYSLSVQPQMRQAITSFTPEDNKPRVFEVGFRFKYLFK